MISGTGNIISNLEGSGTLNVPAPSCGGYPTEAQVESPVVFGNNSEFTGTLVAAVTKTIDVTANDVTPLTGDIVTFTRSGTMTPDSWTVDFGDGNIRSTSGATITHKYRNPSTYTVRVWAGAVADLANIVVKTNYITATEDDLSAYSGAGSLASWVNFQDLSTLTLNANEELTAVSDRGTVDGWIINGGITNPPLAIGNDLYGQYRYLQPNPHALTGELTVSSTGRADSDDLIVNDPLDEMVIDVASETGHLFMGMRNNSDFINMRFISAYDETNYYMRQTAYNVIWLVTSAWSGNVAFTAPNYQKWGHFFLFEMIFDGAGGIGFYLDGVLAVQLTGITGNWHFGMFGGYVAAQHTNASVIGWNVFTGVNLTGANLTANRNYWYNKFDTPNLTTPPV